MNNPDFKDPRKIDTRRELPLLNDRIREKEVRLIDEEGNQLGIVLTKEALSIARDKGLDLFLVQPDSAPPVARILDYGKFKFEQEKKARETKKKQHIMDVKELKMSYKIEEHDYQVKLKSAQKFLSDGDKIKVHTKLRGREIQHANLAIDLMSRFADHLTEFAIIDKEAKIEGKSVIMILSPHPQKGKKTSIAPRNEENAQDEDQ